MLSQQSSLITNYMPVASKPEAEEGHFEKMVEMSEEAPSESANRMEEENMNQSISWVAEDVGEEEEVVREDVEVVREEVEVVREEVFQEQMREEVIRREERVAVTRPVSIALPLIEEATALNEVGQDSPTYTYSLGQGEANVVQHSSLLLTPGAEAPVLCVTNPFFASQLPRVVLQNETSTVATSKLATPIKHLTTPIRDMTSPSGYMTTPQQEDSKSGGIQSDFVWSISRQMGQSAGSQQMGVASQSKGGSSVASTYTVTLTKPLMSSTVVRSKLPKTSSSSKEETDHFSGIEEQKKRVCVIISTFSFLISNAPFL